MSCPSRQECVGTIVDGQCGREADALEFRVQMDGRTALDHRILSGCPIMIGTIIFINVSS